MGPTEIYFYFVQEKFGNFCLRELERRPSGNVGCRRGESHFITWRCRIDILLARNVMRCLIKSAAIADIASLSLSLAVSTAIH